MPKLKGPLRSSALDTSAPTVTLSAATLGTLHLADSAQVMSVVANADQIDSTLVSAAYTGNAQCAVTVSGSDLTLRTVTVSACSGNGSVALQFAEGFATRTDANGDVIASAGVLSDAIAVVNPDSSTPTVSLASGPTPALIRTGTTVSYTLTYAGTSNITLTSNQIQLHTTGTATCSSIAIATPSLLTRTVSLSSCVGDGTVGISVAAGTASSANADGSPNSAPGAGPSVSFTVDNTAPMVAVTAPASGTYVTLRNNSSSFVVTGSCNADGNGRTVSLLADGVNTGLAQAGGACNGTSWTAMMNTTGLSSGAHVLTASLSDALGNTRISSPITLNVDLNPAVIAIDNPSQTGTFTTGSTNDLTFTLSNSTHVSAQSITFDAQSAPYSVVLNTCGGTLNPGSTCSYVLRFTSPGERINGNGTFSTSLTAHYDNASATTSASRAVSQTGAPVSVTVAALYSNAQKWTAYVRNDGSRVPTTNNSGVKDILTASNTACDGSEENQPAGYSACIHGGELKKVVLPAGSACTGLSLAENLGGSAGVGAFNWKCVAAGGHATYYSLGLQETKGLRDLVTAAAWKNNAVTISDGTYNLYQSTAGAWWTNPVSAAPVANGAFGAQWGVYTISASDTKYRQLSAGHISVVTLSGAQLGASGGHYTFDDNGNLFNWFETDLNQLQGGGAYGLLFYGSFNQVRGSNIYTQDYALVTYSGSSLVLQSRLDSTYSPVTIGGNYNTLWKVQSSNSGSDGFNITGAVGTTLSELTGGGHVGSFLILGSTTSQTTISHLTTVNNSVTGFRVGTPNGYGATTISQAMVANNGSGGFSFGGYAQVTGSNLLSTDNANDGIHMAGSAQLTLQGHYVAGNNGSGASSDCTTISTSDPGPGDWKGGNGVSWNGSSCADSSGSGAYNYTPGRTLASSILGQTGAAAALNWFNLASDYSFWGYNSSAFPSANNRGGECVSGTNCAPWDVRLKSTDPLVLNSQGSLSSATACPAAAYEEITDTMGRTYLVNATEVPGMGGNMNGLCESGETCVFSPNIGAYQGEGAYTSACTFTPTGNVQAVTLLGRATNGI